MNDLKELFKYDFIKIGKYRLRPLSVSWWTVRCAQGLGILSFAYFWSILFLTI